MTFVLLTNQNNIRFLSVFFCDFCENMPFLFFFWWGFLGSNGHVRKKNKTDSICHPMITVVGGRSSICNLTIGMIFSATTE